ncbi:hypothetical protein MRX96_020891 [Rhipicephalus microplus]
MTKKGKTKGPDRKAFTQPPKPTTSDPGTTSECLTLTEAPAPSTTRSAVLMPEISKPLCVLMDEEIVLIGHSTTKLYRPTRDSTRAAASISLTTDDPASNALPTSSYEEMDTPAATRKRTLDDDV